MKKTEHQYALLYEVQLSFTLYLPVWVSWSRGRILYLPSKLLGLAASWWKISPQLTHHTLLQFKEIKLTLARVSTLYATYLSRARVRGRVRVGLAVLLEDPDHSCGDVVCFIGSSAPFRAWLHRGSQLELSLLQSQVTRNIHSLLKTSISLFNYIWMISPGWISVLRMGRGFISLIWGL